jgi:tetratricopeptide (TPR) repeat protein
MLPEATPQSAEELFQRGINYLEHKQYQQSIKLIQAAMEQDKLDGANKGTSMRHLSYLGLALVLSSSRSEEGLKLCQQATKRDFFDADIFCNLGIAYMRNRLKGPAFDAFRKGLALVPRHRRILEELARVERRDSRVFSKLSRDHFLNYFFGLFRHRMRLLFNRAPGVND